MSSRHTAYAHRMSRGRRARRHGASLEGPLASWTNSIVSSREAERQQERAGERALDLYHNDAMGHGVMESLLVETVGIGLTPTPSPKSEWLGFDTEWESKYHAAALRIWEEHGLDCRRFFDASRMLDYYGLQGLGYFNWKLLGIGVFQVISKPRKHAPLSTCLLPINPFRLITPCDASGRKEIYDGIEVDKDGEPKRVWISKPGSHLSRPTMSQCSSFDIWDKETGLPRFLLVTDVRNIGEYRQDSVLGPMISEIRHSNDLAEASVVGAMIRNLYTMFVNDFGQGTIGKDTPWDQRIIETNKGQILVGHGKEKPTFFQHDAAPSRYSEMFGAIIDRLGMATGRGAENISRKFQASYSASKASMEKADQFNDFEHRVLNTQFNQPVQCWLQYEAMLRGLLPVSSKDHFLKNMYAYTHCEHQPQPFRQIDRERTAKSNTLELGSHTSNYRKIYGEKGKNWKEELKQTAKEKQYLKKLEEEFNVDMSSAKIPDTAWKPEETEDDSSNES
ncbi:MAG: phage portal protein [Desulfovibrio sp.]